MLQFQGSAAVLSRIRCWIPVDGGSGSRPGLGPDVTSALAFGTGVYLLARPFLGFTHELLVFLLGRWVCQLGGLGASLSLSGHIPLDPIYTSTMFLLLASVQASGIAIAEPLGGLLHGVLPQVFLPSAEVAEGAWVSAVIQPGAAIMARSLVDLGANVLVLLLALLLVRLGLKGRGLATGWGRVRSSRRWMVITGALLQAHLVVDHLAADPLSPAELEATGVTYGFSVLFTGPAAERPRLSVILLALPEPLRQALTVLLVIGLAYVLALGLLWIGIRIVRLARRLPLAGPAILGLSRRGEAGLTVPVSRRLGLATFALAVATSPLGSLAVDASKYGDEPVEVVPAASAVEPAQQALSLTPATAVAEVAPVPTNPPNGERPSGQSALRQARANGPRQPVVVSGGNFSYSYRVGGVRQVVRGMGYNPTFAKLPVAERSALYDRDFALMRQAGVNTILGWVTEEFDGLLLDKAAQHDLGVILPYHLVPELDYTDPTVRESVRIEVLQWVRSYKDHPALRMWGPGNEVLHKLVYPSWMKLRGDPIQEARADAFADFYVSLIDQIHEMDPFHPVIYRDAEDAYLPRLRDALKRSGVARPWFVYGINIYTPRLAEVIAHWPEHGLDAALLISEFGPGGAGPADRPRGYRDMWAMIRSQPARVLGGAPYVWATQGPEEVDRIFGLVDPLDRAVDGSLGAVARMYQGEAAGEIVPPPTAYATAACDQQVAKLARDTIQGLQTNPRTMVFQAFSPPSIMGPLDNLPADPLQAQDLKFAKVEDPARLVWQQDSGYQAEWWVTWSPPSRPGDQVSLLIRERTNQLEVAYVYHGPPSGASVAGGIC